MAKRNRRSRKQKQRDRRKKKGASPPAADARTARRLREQGEAALREGRLQEGVGLLQRAAKANPQDAASLRLLASGLRLLGALPEALAACRRAQRLRSKDVDVLNELCAILFLSGEYPEALAVAEEGLAQAPAHVLLLNNLGMIQSELYQHEDAARTFERVLEQSPDHVHARRNLARVLHSLGRDEEAIDAFREALRQQPDFARAHHDLAVTLIARERYAEALAHLEETLRLRPDFAQARQNLAIALIAEGKEAEAQQHMEEALRLQPADLAYLEVWMKVAPLAETLRACERAAQAVAATQKGQLLQATAEAYLLHGRVEEALACCRRGLELPGATPVLHSHLLLNLHYISEPSHAEIFQAHEQWAEQHGTGQPVTLSPNRRGGRGKRPLRVGYLSSDFRRHSVAYFIEPILAAHDRAEVQPVCYYDRRRADAVTCRIHQQVESWRDIWTLSDRQVADQIERDQIDILVDLEGHTGRRLTLFARKPAPVQVTYLGYPDTTGLPAMDYRLTDGLADPKGQTEPWHTETLVRLAPCFLAFEPPDAVPIEPACPLRTGEPVTFGSLNNIAKISNACLDLWAQLLRHAASSRLLLKARGFRDPDTREYFCERFAARDVDPARLLLVADLPSLSEHLEVYNRIDVALDTFPYHGTTTTCEAAWMGVPTVSLASTTHASRVGVSLLSVLGLEANVANTPDAFAEKACALAEDPARLEDLRAGLRQRMRDSALLDHAGFTRRLEAAYREMWERSVASSG